MLITPAAYSQCYKQFGVGETSVTVQATDGTLWGWGWGVHGQLGNTNYYNANPVQISTDTDWDKLFVTKIHNFATKADGTLWGIGRNDYGQLGFNAITDPIYTTFQQIGTTTNWAKVQGTGYTIVALKTDGTIWGWGENDDGQLTAQHSGMQLAPVQIGTATD